MRFTISRVVARHDHQGGHNTSVKAYLVFVEAI